MIAADIEWHVDPQDPETTTHRGREAVKRYALGWIETMQISLEVLELVDTGDHVVSWVRISGRGATSGVPAEFHVAFVWTLRDRLIVRVQETQDRAEALEAAGLRGEDLKPAE